MMWSEKHNMSWILKLYSWFSKLYHWNLIRLANPEALVLNMSTYVHRKAGVCLVSECVLHIHLHIGWQEQETLRPGTMSCFYIAFFLVLPAPVLLLFTQRGPENVMGHLTIERHKTFKSWRLPKTAFKAVHPPILRMRESSPYSGM